MSEAKDSAPAPQKGWSNADYFSAFLTVIIIICGITFFIKLFYFTSTLWSGGSEMLGFALLPVTNYLLVASGFLLLLIWAFFNGQLSEIEQAKYDLIEENDRWEEELKLYWAKKRREEA